MITTPEFLTKGDVMDAERAHEALVKKLVVEALRPVSEYKWPIYEMSREERALMMSRLGEDSREVQPSPGPGVNGSSADTATPAPALLPKDDTTRSRSSRCRPAPRSQTPCEEFAYGSQIRRLVVERKQPSGLPFERLPFDPEAVKARAGEGF